MFNVPFMTVLNEEYVSAVRDVISDLEGRDKRIKFLEKIIRERKSTETVTHYEILGGEEYKGSNVTRVSLTPATGKTHQLRMACLHGLGAPINRDVGYGGGLGTGTGMTLHAKEISFLHPMTEKRFVIQSVCPF